MALDSSHMHRHPYIYPISLQRSMLLTFCFGAHDKIQMPQLRHQGARVRFDRVEFAFTICQLKSLDFGLHDLASGM